MEAYARLKQGTLVIAADKEGHYDLPYLAKQYNIAPIFIEQKLNGLTMSREAVRDFLQSLDVYISPASESFGLPALEAQACGVPTIAIDHGAAKEVLNNGAVYCNVADYLETTIGKIALISVPDLYRKMRFMIQVKEAYEKTARKALENAQRWPWENAVKKMLEALEEVK
jgi:glycosyltransferase involved in cell wall biosynthesis